METIHTILKKYYGYDTFRPLQEDIIQSVLDGKDTLALLPTGGGKSMCFQIPALCLDGICIVVTPLIALMKDQVQNLLKRNISAVAIYSGMSYKETDAALDSCVYAGVKFLYVSPERLLTDLFRERFKKMPVCLIAIDEAHCISQWGYDFRPPYLQIAELRPFYPQVPIIALTATATTKVCADIQDKLEFKKINIFKSSFVRNNLSFIVRETDNKEDKLIEILRNVPGTGVVYVRNRKKTKDIAEFLIRKKVNANFYHAGLEHEVRNLRQENWINNKTRIIVCTNAFGMGIDKPNVRVVVHLDIPESIEAYYQEAGRAGRDGFKAYTGLIYDNHDIVSLKEFMDKQYPAIDFIRNVYQQLGNHFQLALGAGEGQNFDFDLMEFCKQFQLKPAETKSALKIIEQNNYIYVSDALNKLSTIYIPVDRETLYRYQIENKQFEPVIKLILRTSPGVFDAAMPVHERELAYHLSIADDKLRELLHFLHEQGVLEYSPIKIQPQLTFVKARVTGKELVIDTKLLQRLKEAAELRFKAITEYATNKSECRVKNLLRYFDEETGNCGQCDICVEKGKLDITEKEFDTVYIWLEKTLTENSMMPEELFKLKMPVRKEKVAEALSFLTDNKKIKHTKDNQLIWVK